MNQPEEQRESEEPGPDDDPGSIDDGVCSTGAPCDECKAAYAAAAGLPSPGPDLPPEAFDRLNVAAFKACAWFVGWYGISCGLRGLRLAFVGLSDAALLTKQYHAARALHGAARGCIAVHGRLEVAGAYCLMRSYAAAAGDISNLTDIADAAVRKAASSNAGITG